MHIPSLAEEIVESVIEEMAASGDSDWNIYCHGCLRFSEVIDQHLPMCPLCGSYQVDFIVDDPPVLEPSRLGKRPLKTAKPGKNTSQGRLHVRYH